MTEEEDADQLLAMKWANETVPSWRNTYDLIRRVRSEERDSRLRAERAYADMKEAFDLKCKAYDMFQGRLDHWQAKNAATQEDLRKAYAALTAAIEGGTSYKAALATAERERDEARGQRDLWVQRAVDRTRERDAAQKRIEGLERWILNAGAGFHGHGGGCPRSHIYEINGVVQVVDPRPPCNCWLTELERLKARAALSSPAVTAEGKKLGEGGGGT